MGKHYVTRPNDIKNMNAADDKQIRAGESARRGAERYICWSDLETVAQYKSDSCFHLEDLVPIRHGGGELVNR